jgi:hypothetical protein
MTAYRPWFLKTNVGKEKKGGYRIISIYTLHLYVNLSEPNISNEELRTNVEPRQQNPNIKLRI